MTGQIFMTWGAKIVHFSPWRDANVAVTVPGGDRRWTPEEIATALNTAAFNSRHPGLRQSFEAIQNM